MLGHKKCLWCTKIGHKQDMVRYGVWWCYFWFHKDCYIERHEYYKKLENTKKEKENA